MVYRQDIYTDKQEYEYLQGILDMEDTSGLEEGVCKNYEAVFEDGRFIEISVCIGQDNAYVDAVLYEYDGFPIGELEPQWDISGEYIFENGPDEIYIVNIALAD